MKGLRHNLREPSVEVATALSHILQVMVLVWSLQVLTEAQEIVFHILQVPMEAQEIVFHILQVPMEARGIVFHILQVPMEAQGIVFHILRVQTAVLVKDVFHSLERTGFFHIQQAHLRRHTAQDDLLDDSLERTDFFHIQQAHLRRHVGQDDLQEDSR